MFPIYRLMFPISNVCFQYTFFVSNRQWCFQTTMFPMYVSNIHGAYKSETGSGRKGDCCSSGRNLSLPEMSGKWAKECH